MNEVELGSLYNPGADDPFSQAANEAIPDERALVQAARAGDFEAFNLLVLRYQNLAYNVAFRILLDEDNAKDITQNSFLSAYRNLNRFSGASFRAWLMRIVTNACIDELRRRQRHPTISLEPANDDDEEIESPFWIADRSSMPETVQERAELQAAIRKALEGVTAEYRVVLVLADIEGLDYNEIATILGKPLGTIKSRLARARLQMRARLAGYLGK